MMQVVNNLGVMENIFILIQGSDKQGDEACRPVMAVYNIGLPAESYNSLQHSFIVESQSLVIIFIKLFGFRLFEHSLSFEIFIVIQDRKSTRLNSSHVAISYAVFCF